MPSTSKYEVDSYQSMGHNPRKTLRSIYLVVNYNPEESAQHAWQELDAPPQPMYSKGTPSSLGFVTILA